MATSLPAFGDISVIPQEHSVLLEETIPIRPEEITTVEESQSQSLLRDINDDDMEHEETTTVEETQDQESQSQSLLRDMEHEHEADTEAVPVPMQAESSPALAPEIDSEDQTGSELNNAQDTNEALNTEASEQGESEILEINSPEGDDITEENSEETENTIDVEKDNEEGSASEKLFHLPLAKIKRIMKTDEDTNLISKEALVAVAICTEHFISMIAQQSYKLAAAGKKKTVGVQHVKSTLSSSSVFDFLEGAIPQHEI